MGIILRCCSPAIVLLASCSASNSCDAPLTKLSPETEKIVISELESKGIEYHIREDGRICVSFADAEISAEVLGSVVQSAIPVETSASLDKEVQKRVIGRFKKEGITFTERDLEGHTFLVWSDVDDQRARNIIDEEISKFTNEFMSK